MENGAHIDAVDEDGNQPLHLACKQGLAKIGNLLLSYGASTNVVNKHGQTPLHIVADGMKDSPALCVILLENGANIDAVDEDGNQPFHLACKQNHTETGIVLLNYGPNVTSMYQNKERTFATEFTQTLAIQAIESAASASWSLLTCLLYWAVYNGNRAVTRFLLKLGANPNGLANSHSISLTPLHVAVNRKEDCPELSQLLIEYGSDVNASDENGYQALHMSSGLGHTETVKCLVAHTKTNINGVNGLGLTPLLVAIGAKTVNPELCETLLEHNATTDAVDEDGNQPLHVACRRDHGEIVNVLLAHGACSNAANKHGETPLHTVANSEEDSPELCEILLKHDARIDAVDVYGNQAFHLACKQHHTRAATTLLSHGPSVTTTILQDHGRTFTAHFTQSVALEAIRHVQCTASTDQILLSSLLYWVVYNGYEQLMKVLLKGGANANGLANGICFSLTPLHVAADQREDSPTLCQLLLEHGAQIDAVDEFGQQPLHLTCSHGYTHSCIVLINHGADTNALNRIEQMPLHTAAEWSDDSKICEILLEHGAKINAADEAGNQPLHLACYQGCTEAVKLMVSCGANTNAVNKCGQTPLHAAAERLNDDCPELCEILLKHGAKINAVNEDGNQPFHMACKRGHTETGIVLLNHGPNVTCQYQNMERTFAADFTQTLALKATRAIEGGGSASQSLLTCLLYWAVYNGNHKDIHLLLKLGANPNGLADDHSIYPTPLHIAVNRKEDSPELSQILIDHGSDIDTVDESGNHALHLSSSLGHTETVKWLVTHTTNVNGVNGLGLTSLLAAVKAETARPELCETLLQHGARTDAVDEDGNQPLHLACRRDHVEIVDILLSNEASLNAANKYGQTPLHTAAISEKDSPGMCEVLLKHGANINAVDKDGNQPLHLACRMDNSKTGDLLLCNGAMTNEPNKQGETALHIVAGRRKVSQTLCKDLLEQGARLDAADKNGKQPLHIACEKENVAVGELLLSSGADILALDSHGNTPNLDKLLMAAVENGCTCINACQLILEKGANPNYIGENGIQPLTVAVEKRNTELCCLLLHRGASIPINGRKELDEALCHAMDRNMTDLIRLLLSHGVNIRLARIGEQTVWERSEESGTQDMACLLRAAGKFLSSDRLFIPRVTDWVFCIA